MLCLQSGYNQLTSPFEQGFDSHCLEASLIDFVKSNKAIEEVVAFQKYRIKITYLYEYTCRYHNCWYTTRNSQQEDTYSILFSNKRHL